MFKMHRTMFSLLPCYTFQGLEIILASSNAFFLHPPVAYSPFCGLVMVSSFIAALFPLYREGDFGGDEISLMSPA
jgi:hypothetical protein